MVALTKNRIRLLVVLWLCLFTLGAGHKRHEFHQQQADHEDKAKTPLTNDLQSGQVCTTSPCLHGGTCVEIEVGEYKCSCAPYYIGSHCEKEPLTNVALARCGANCTASSVQSPEYHCYTSLAGRDPLDTTEHFWATTNGDRVGAWFRIQFSNYFRVQHFATYDRYYHRRASQKLMLRTGDYKTREMTLMCLEPDNTSNKFWQQFDLGPVITDSLYIEVLAVCEDSSTTEYVGLRGIEVFANYVPLKNYAASAFDATCTASSAYNPNDFGCENAFDGSELQGIGNEWVSAGEGVGAWIQVDFAGGNDRNITAVGFLQRCDRNSQNSALTLEFSDQSTPQQVNLECFFGVPPAECEGQYWQQFDLDPYVTTSYVRVTITAVCAAENNGFREIRVFGPRDTSSV